MEGEVGVCAAESCNEVVFESGDGAFGGIATMHAGGGKLEVDVGGMQELL